MKKLTPEVEEQLKEKIEKLNKTGSGDFQSLLREASKYRKVVELNIPQAVASRATAKTVALEWGRGTGKTTMRGERWNRILHEMPRSTGLFIGPTYQFILTRIVPSLVQGLEMFGIYKDLHYFIGKEPPRSWRKDWGTAYQPPEKGNRYITFWNGVGVHLISHDVAGDGRGLNTDWIDGDEAGILKGENLQENTDPTLRGTNTKAFEKSVFFGSKFYTSSTPLTQEGQWFIDLEEKARENPKTVQFIPATCKWNLHNLRPGYLEEAKETAYSLWKYEAEYENKRPVFIQDGFYPLLNPERHGYTNFNYDHYHSIKAPVDCRGDNDLVRGVPLILGIDWGASINCLTVNQHITAINEYRTIKSMYVLGSEQKIQEDLFNDFHKYYSHHNSRTLYLYYDNSGNVNTGITRQTRAEQARRQLQSLGWQVQLRTIGGRNPDHELKHVLWSMMLRGDHPRLPTYRINMANCRELYLSMKHARARAGSDGAVKKDKSSERKTSTPREHATDLSDANDAPVFGMFRHLMRGGGGLVPSTK